MLFPTLLVVISAALLIAGARWAKIDEDDILRKIIVGAVQLMCLASMAIGVACFAQRAANGPPPKDDTEVSPGPSAPRRPIGGYVPPTVRVTPLQPQPATNDQPPTPQNQPDPNAGQPTEPPYRSQPQFQPDPPQPTGADPSTPDPNNPNPTSNNQPGDQSNSTG